LIFKQFIFRLAVINELVNQSVLP